MSDCKVCNGTGVVGGASYGGRHEQLACDCTEDEPMQKPINLRPRVPMGDTVLTPGVEALLKFPSMSGVELAPFLNRHSAGDWGELCQEDKDLNERSLKEGLRLMSCYELYGEKIWIVTEADRSVTTVLLPEEY